MPAARRINCDARSVVGNTYIFTETGGECVEQ